MDIREKIEELAEKIKNDGDFAREFRKDPVRAVENVIGVDLPDDKIRSIVDGIKAKADIDSIGDAVGGLFGKK